MNKHYPQHNDPETPAQISADLVARMNRAEQQMETPAQQESRVDVSVESVDFGSVLESVSSREPDPLPEAFVRPDPGASSCDSQRDRNLSRIIEMIRDEGPAGEEEGVEPAEDMLEIGSGAQAAAGKAKEEPDPPQETARPADTRQEPPARSPFLTGLVVLLTLAVAGLSFLVYQQVQRQGELEARVMAAQQVLALIDERSRALEERITAAGAASDDRVGRSELEQALERQRQHFAGELLHFATLFAMPLQVEPAPLAAREAAPKPELKERAASLEQTDFCRQSRR